MVFIFSFRAFAAWRKAVVVVLPQYPLRGLCGLRVKIPCVRAKPGRAPAYIGGQALNLRVRLGSRPKPVSRRESGRISIRAKAVGSFSTMPLTVR